MVVVVVAVVATVVVPSTRVPVASFLKTCFFTKWVQNRPFDLKLCSAGAKSRARPRQIDQNIDEYRKKFKIDQQLFTKTCHWDPRGPPEHLGGTNLDDKDMPDRFQAFPEVKTGLKQPKMIDFRVNNILRLS